MNDNVKIFIVEDHPIFRMGLIELINLENDMKVCGEAEDVAEAKKKINALKPDLVVLDLLLQNSNGLDLINDLRKDGSKIPILVLSMHDELLHAQRCIFAGANGYIMKQEASSSVVGAIRNILAGNIHVSDKIITQIMYQARRGSGSLRQSPVGGLTDRELEVFQLIGKGMTPGDIARRLNLSVKTIGTHKENIKEKMGIKHGSELVRFAVLWTERVLPKN